MAVLGHYPEYRQVAEVTNAQHFDLGDAARWLTSSQCWRQNKAFLDAVIACGGCFLLATPPDMARDRSNYRLELDYLNDKGYRLGNLGPDAGNAFLALVPA